MCGKFGFHHQLHEVEGLRQEFNLPSASPPKLGFLVCPSQEHPVWIKSNQAISMVWGFLPPWAEDDQTKILINARSETAPQKPSFREAFLDQRCLVPASGFFEWDHDSKQPWWFSPQNQKPWLFAGLWQTKPFARFCLLTTEANQVVGQIHHRMPVIIAPERAADWLGGTSPPALLQLMRPWPNGQTLGHPVSTRVNKAHQGGLELIQPLTDNQQLSF